MPKRKTPAAKASPKNSKATSRPSLAIEIDPDLLATAHEDPGLVKMLAEQTWPNASPDFSLSPSMRIWSSKWNSV
jgi:hypothetical protein